MEEKETLEKDLSTATEAATEEKVAAEAQSVEPKETEIPEASETMASEEGSAEKAETGSEEAEKPMSKKRRIVNGIMLGVQIFLVVIALAITLIVIFNPRKNESASFGLHFMSVQSDSMDGDQPDSFKEGDLVVAVTPKNGGQDLQVGQIVTFDDIKDGQRILNTHRIVAIEGDDVKKYITRGDNPKITDNDSRGKLPNEIKAVYVFHVKGLGTALDWLREPESGHIIYVIIIPLAVLLIYNIYLVAQILVESKLKKAKALAAENAKQAALASIDEEEIKRRAIEEYLKSKGMTQDPAANPDDKGDTK